jgi:hypothetical protein
MELLIATGVSATRSILRSHEASRPAVNWKQGAAVSIAGWVSDDDAQQVFGNGEATESSVGLVSQRT